MEQLVVVADAEDLAEIQRLAEAETVTIETIGERNLVDPASITLVLIGTSLAISTVAYLIEQRKGGQVFDLRTGAARRAYRSRGVAYGLVQIIAPDGTVQVEVKEPRGMFGQVLDTIRLIIKDLSAPVAESIGAAAKEAVGDLAVVHTTPES
jgi:hypothetical protein